jgi:hypothetical protein
MIHPKTIMLSQDGDPPPPPSEAKSYLAADTFLRKAAAALGHGRNAQVRALVVFEDLFVWTSVILVARGDAEAEHFVQRAIQADWEFNAGIRPDWWPQEPEADRMWGLHYREDRANGRAELARMRLERYDLAPVALNRIPPREPNPREPNDETIDALVAT